MAVSSRFSHKSDIALIDRPHLGVGSKWSGIGENQAIQTRFLNANQCPTRIKSGAGFRSKTLCLSILTRFLNANRHPPRIKSGAGFRLKTLVSLFDAFSSREPASTSLENALLGTA
jgi:hypothetical protein